MKINKVSPQDNNFLQILTTIAKPPKKLYFIGKLPTDRPPTVAIVGSRKPTSYGEEVTYRLAYDLSKKGVLIISGLAYGIDKIAHQATLDANGQTIAVLAHGLNHLYPATHKHLAQKIIQQGGALLSEYSPSTEVKGFQFLERNRLISGLADAVVVTEATKRSGTMSTASHALEQGREVLAVPGNITSLLSVGCNNLIKQGAFPITSAEDVLEIIYPQLIQAQTKLPLGEPPAETNILELLQAGVRDGNELQVKSKLDVTLFSITMTTLEINGSIKALGGNQWTLR